MSDAPRTMPQPAPADAAVGYRPLAVSAIGAFAVAVLTAVIVTAIALASWAKGRAILSEPVVFLAVFGVVLSLIARWQIRRSEGTRAGLGLTRASIWLCVLFGLGYAAFLFGIGWAVRMQARELAADKWFGYMAAGQPELAFRLTRDPAQQRSISENPDAIRRRFGATDMPGFNMSEVVRQYRTWKDKVSANWQGMKQMETTPAGYIVEMNYQLRSPEGRFDFEVVASCVDDPESGERGWQIVYPRTGLKGKQLTRLGQLCDELKYECAHRFLTRWTGEFPNTPDPLAIFRIDGKVPPQEQREKLASELKSPGVVNLMVGGPMMPTMPPTLRVDADGVRLLCYVELNLPSLKPDPIPAHVIVRVMNDNLVKEVIDLQKPGWEQQPTQPRWDVQLKGVPDLKVVEVNARPGDPREGIQPRAVQMGGGG
jgi:hypothetical protein